MSAGERSGGGVVVWQFGHYRMEGLISRGGMGEVHRAYDGQHDRMVAIKLLSGHLAGDDEYRRRFTREARAAARLREPHVIPIHAYGEIDGRLYLDMRLVEGGDLRDALSRHGPMSPSAAADVVSQVASALDAAHAEGLVHRDVKPSNVLIDAGGFAYLVDFGIARAMAAHADITGTGIPIGTVAYMAPERFQPDGRVDHRADVYSLACLLFQCLTGVPPFPDENPLALMNAHLNRVPPTPADHRPELSRAFDDVIATGMAKNPGERHQSAGALAAAARQAAGQPAAHPATARLAAEPTGARPATSPIPRPRRREPAGTSRGGRWWRVAAVVVVVAALAAGTWLALPGLRGDDPAKPPPATAPPGTTAPGTTTTGTETPGPDLSVSVAITAPSCDGSYIVIVGSAVDPDFYQRDVQAFLDASPGARYLHAPTTGCASLRQRLDGADIYSVYYGPFPDKDTACARRGTVGRDSFVRRLDDTSSSQRAVGCG